jgi:hypothetical protein
MPTKDVLPERFFQAEAKKPEKTETLANGNEPPRRQTARKAVTTSLP